MLIAYIGIPFLIDMKRQKVITKHGYPISGRVVKIKHIRNRYFMKTGDCTLVVLFEWKGRKYEIKTINSAEENKYSIGSEIDLLYLPKYRNKVMINERNRNIERGNQ